MSSCPDLPSYRTLLGAAGGGVGTITLDRPDRRNAIGDWMRDELADVFTRFDHDENIRAIVLTGAGGARPWHRRAHRADPTAE